MLAPRSAAPVRIKPNNGPAQGAQSRPVATPSRSEGRIEDPPFAAPCSADRDKRAPSATPGRIIRSDNAGNSSVTPNRAKRAKAAMRPYWLASTAHPPPMAAKVATTANVAAMPTSNGSPPRAKDRSARANTKGRTGRIQGLTMVRAPPR